MNEKWGIKSLLRVLPDTVLRVAFEYIFCCCEEHDGDYVANKNRSVKPIWYNLGKIKTGSKLNEITLFAAGMSHLLDDTKSPLNFQRITKS